IAVDNTGRAYVTGRCSSTDFPTAQAFQGTFGGGNRDAFITKLGPNGTALGYSTYLGGSALDQGNEITLDGSGNIYVVGRSDSTNFPTKQAFQGTNAGNQDAFIAKLDPTGATLAYSTYLGGASLDQGIGIALDGSGNVYVSGRSSSTNFPTKQAFQGTNAGNQDAFIAKLDPTGATLAYSTYLGGASLDQGIGIALDGSGNVYVSGRSSSTNFPTKQAFQGTNAGGYDAFITKLVPSGTALAYSTYLGGGNDERGIKIAVDRSGKAYVTGITHSTDFPTKQAFQGTNAGDTDAFVTKLVPSGTALIYSTYLGGTDTDEGYGIALDPSGSAYATGKSNSTDFPTRQAFQGTNAGDYDAFITKLVPSGTALAYSTYLGGTGTDHGTRTAIDESDNTYVTGFTNSTDFPTGQAFQGANAGSYDAFVFKIRMPSVGDELAADFGSIGVWHYDHSGPTWAGIGGPAEDLENLDGNLAVDFGAGGLWFYNGFWKALAGNPEAMEACGALYADFGANGLWRYDGAWTAVAPNPDDMQCCGGILYVDFGVTGLWGYDGTWRALAGNPTGMWCFNGDLYTNLKGNLWRYDGSWAGLAPIAEEVEDGGPDLYVDFGANGLWRYDGAWTAIAPNPDEMQFCDDALYADHGANGLWRYDGASGTALASNPEDLCCADALYVDFGATGDPTGLWRYDGSWIFLADDTTVMTDVDINP
ncbi:MAG: hypothetical protein GY849_08860, partial [Deltaproteobacteria bacterium]|nr:hypothetical protein [Deltaproteobacteria bacterium]